MSQGVLMSTIMWLRTQFKGLWVVAWFCSFAWSKQAWFTSGCASQHKVGGSLRHCRTELEGQGEKGKNAGAKMLQTWAIMNEASWSSWMPYLTDVYWCYMMLPYDRNNSVPSPESALRWNRDKGFCSIMFYPHVLRATAFGSRCSFEPCL